jgi:hypothetical protein
MAHDLRVFDFLGQLADTLCSDPDDDRGGLLVHVAPAEGGVTVGMLDVEGQAPVELLLGMVAPDEWLALGLAAHGWAYPLEAAPQRNRQQRRRTSSVVLVHRSGEVVSRLRVGEEVHREPPAYGLTLDGLQRALGLPTAPPLVSTADFFAWLWLVTVIGAAEQRAGSLSWAEARALHPAVEVLGGLLIEGADDPVAASQALAHRFDWDWLRWSAVEDKWRLAGLTPTEAAWCDAGAYSRWVMHRLPGFATLLGEVRRTAGSGVARRCASVLRHLGVLSRSAA